MAIIGSIRKHSGLAVILVGVAIAAFVIGDFGKKRMKGPTRSDPLTEKLSIPGIQQQGGRINSDPERELRE